MKKAISFVLAFLLVFSIVTVGSMAANDESIPISSGDVVSCDVTYSKPVTYSISVPSASEMVLEVEADHSVYILVTDNTGKEIAPTLHSAYDNGASNTDKDIGGYALECSSSNKNAKGTFVYNIYEGEYFITLKYNITASLVTMTVTTTPVKNSCQLIDGIYHITSGEYVYANPAYRNNETYKITSADAGRMTIDIETDGNIYLVVTDSSGKEIAPSSYTENSEYGIWAGISGNWGHVRYSRSAKTKVANVTMVYDILKGEYQITLREGGFTISATKMEVNVPLSALPTTSKVLVNGAEVSFDAYNINGNNYFKLRDLAYVLNGTQKQFEVTWDGKANAIGLIPGKAYTAVGAELAAGDGVSKTALACNSAIYINGKPVTLTAYNIKGNNYFKLRDIGTTFNFDVSWDGVNKVISIDTSKGYSEN